MSTRINPVAPWQTHAVEIGRTSYLVLRCPFCKGAPDLVEVETTPQIGLCLPRYIVQCTACAASGPFVDKPDGGIGSIQKWNERVSAD